MAVWNLCLQSLLLTSLAQPPGTPAGGPPGSPAVPGGGAAAQTTTQVGPPETPLGLHVFGLLLFGAITTVLVYPTGRYES